MRKTTKVLPDSFLRCIDPKDKPDGPAGWTYAECQERYGKRSETNERKVFDQWLLLHKKQIEVLTPRTDKKTTIKKGWPDYSLFCSGQTLFGDFKSTGKKLSADQEEVKSRLERKGFLFYVWYSAQSAIQDSKLFFGL